MTTHEEARDLLERYRLACVNRNRGIDRIDEENASEKACLDAMTLPAQTIAEQQREIARLKKATDYCVHSSGCAVWKYGDRSAVIKCTCGLDEVLNESA